MLFLRSCSTVFALVLLSAACYGSEHGSVESQGSLSISEPASQPSYRGKPATKATRLVLSAARKHLPKGDFLDGSTMAEHSQERRIAELPAGVGSADYSKRDFVLADASDTIHPSLHAVARDALADRGLFEIIKGIYQVRGDISHITFVPGKTGWIVLDAGSSREFAAGAWALLQQHLPEGGHKAISAVVYSHSHGDHFGGVKGLVTQADVDADQVEIIAPYGFMQELISESVIAGNAMMRRGAYHFGILLEINDQGTGSVPIMATSAGATTLIAPTVVLPEGQGKITHRLVDGIDIEFMDISSAEAPAATLLHLPQWKLLFNSELVSRKLHNVYTLRGAKTRDALGWSKLINRIVHVWGNKLEHMTGPHGPTFSGQAKINEFLRLQRDNYAFLHNQTMKLANSGVTIQDIGESVAATVPERLSRVWHTRGYHGTYSHNARGVINRYLGFYDGNPANLNPLQIKPEATKYVEYMGGADAIMRRAKQDFESGEYRFVATVLNKLVQAQADLWPARHLLADSFEQLAYQAEGPQWRDAYLTAAKELRLGKVLHQTNFGDSSDLLRAASTENMLDAMAIKINAEKAAGEQFSMTLSLSDVNETWLLELSNSVLSYIQLNKASDTDLRLASKRSDFVRLMNGLIGMKQFMALDDVNFEGSETALESLVNAIEPAGRNFSIVPLPG